MTKCEDELAPGSANGLRGAIGVVVRVGVGDGDGLAAMSSRGTASSDVPSAWCVFVPPSVGGLVSFPVINSEVRRTMLATMEVEFETADIVEERAVRRLSRSDASHRRRF